VIGIRTYFLTAVAIFLVGWAVLDAVARGRAPAAADPCAAAQKLDGSGFYADSIAAYVKALKADSSADCAKTALASDAGVTQRECAHAEIVGASDPTTARKELSTILATDPYADTSCITSTIEKYPEPAK
jgi:hypothetical protein